MARIIWQDDKAALSLDLRYHEYIPSQYAVTSRHKYLHPDIPDLPEWVEISDAFR